MPPLPSSSIVPSPARGFRVHPLYWLAFGAMAVSPGAGWAQGAPDAGSLQQRIDQARPLSLPRPQPTAPGTVPTQPPSGLSVRVTGFRLQGNSLLSDAELQAVLAPFLERSLSYTQLQEAAAAVARAYRAAGWVVRAFLPQQDVTAGVITLQVVEAVFGGVRLDGTPPTRISSEYLLQLAAAGQEKGQPLRGPGIDRALLLLGDIPGVAALGSLVPGDREPESVLALRARDTPLLSGSAEWANAGSRSTGHQRFSFQLALNSPLHQGDLMQANGQATEGSQYVQLVAGLPVGTQGSRLSIQAAKLRYRLISPEFAELDGHGGSRTLGADLMVPLVRSRPANLYLNLSAEDKAFDNWATGTLSTAYAVRSLTLGLAGNRVDDWGAGGVSSGSVQLVRGQLDLSGSPNESAVAATTRAAGRYHVLRVRANRLQTLNETFSLQGSASVQAADRNLDSSEKFYLGGAQGVRAYPSSEAGGSTGWMLNAELRKRLPRGWTAAAFYDLGEVRQNHRNDFLGAPPRNTSLLHGAGLSVTWQHESGWTTRMTWARRLGQNPLAKPDSGLDQDGSLVRNRLWFNTQLPF